MNYMNEQILFGVSGQNDDIAEKVIDYYNSIKELFDSWGDLHYPLVEKSIKISENSCSYNRYSIPIFEVNDERDWWKIDKIMDILDAPKELYPIVKSRHNKNIRMIVGIDFDSGWQRIYFIEEDSGYGYEFAHNKYIIKKYKKVSKNNYRYVAEKLKKSISSEIIFNAIMNIIPPINWVQISDRQKDGMIIGYHISTSSKIRLHLLENHIGDLVRYLNRNHEEILMWFEKHKMAYLHWMGIGIDKEGKLEITFYLRCTTKEWDDYYPPLDIATYFRKRVLEIE